MKRTLQIALATGVTLAVCALVILLAGRSPLKALIAFLDGALLDGLGSDFLAISITLQRSATLFLLGLSVLVSFRCGFWNIGAEGQFIMGAIGATAVGVWLPGLPGLVLLPLVLLAGALSGGTWAALAGVLKVRLGVQEIISTIMMNFVAITFLQYVVRGPLSSELNQSPPIGPGAQMPFWAVGVFTRFDLGLVITVLVGVFVWLYVERSVYGFELSVVGSAPTAARHAGLSSARTTLLAVSLSGALAGLAGAIMLTASRAGVLTDAMASGDGYRAIAVALMGALHVGGTVGGAVLFGALEAGALNMESLPLGQNIPRTLTYIVQAMVILFFVYFAARRPPPRAGTQAARSGREDDLTRNDSGPVAHPEGAGP